MDPNRSRDLGYRALEQADREQALMTQRERLTPERQPGWPKDDRRSSSRLPQPGSAPPPGAQD